MSKKEILFSLTENDFDFSYARGSGKGGQKRNKTETAVRCQHKPSGSMGYSDASRSQHSNKVDAFSKCVETQKFKAWLRLEIAKHTGALQRAKEEAEHQMKFVKVEVKQDGKWVDERDIEKVEGQETP